MDNLHKHLDYIEETINRMASNSFHIKNLNVTIIAALIALSIKESDFRIYLISLLPTVVFWILDSFYLYKEKLFRHLYDKIRVKHDNIDFSMDISEYESKPLFFKTLFCNITTAGFYLPFLFVLCILCIVA